MMASEQTYANASPNTSTTDDISISVSVEFARVSGGVLSVSLNIPINVGCFFFEMVLLSWIQEMRQRRVARGFRPVYLCNCGNGGRLNTTTLKRCEMIGDNTGAQVDRDRSASKSIGDMVIGAWQWQGVPDAWRCITFPYDKHRKILKQLQLINLTIIDTDGSRAQA